MLDRANSNSTSASQNSFPQSTDHDVDAHAIKPEIAGDDDLSLRVAQAIVVGGDDRKAEDIVLLDVEDVSYLADYFILMTGFSKVQVRAIARTIQDKVEEFFGRSPLQVEGMTDGAWVLLDYGDVIAHIFTPQEREYYNLEAFWGHARQIALSDFLVVQDSAD